MFIAWGSHADAPLPPYHGWLIGYDTVSREQVAAFNTTPNLNEYLESGDRSGGGSIWQAGQGPACDRSGNIYVMTGNGDVSPVVSSLPSSQPFDSTSSNFGESFLKLTFDPGTRRLFVSDFFTPANWRWLNDGDTDLGSSGPLLIRDNSFVVGGGKEGWLHLLNSRHLGGIEAREHSNGIRGDRQFARLGGHIHGSPVTWRFRNSGGDLIYVWGENDWLWVYRLSDGSDRFDEEVVPGRAFAAAPVQVGTRPFRLMELWRSDRNPGYSNASGREESRSSFNFAKFAYPTIARGKVYVPTFSNELRVYGLH